MSGTSTTFLVGIPTYKRPDDLNICLTTLFQDLGSRRNVRVCVVNDASHDDAYEQVVSKFDERLEYVVLDENSGPGIARHNAFVDASEDYLVGIDDDCIVPEGWFSWIEANVIANEHTDIFVGWTEPVWSQKPSIWDRLTTVPCTYPEPVFTQQGLLTAVGANVVFKREAYQRSGGYSASMRGAVEDCWLSQQILNTGGNYKLLVEAKMGHNAKNGLRTLWRRYHWYGYGGAQFAIMEQNWQLVEVCSNKSFSSILDNLRGNIRNEWKAKHHSPGLSIKRVAYTLSTIVWTTAYEVGWAKGVKKYEKEYSLELPSRPKLKDRYINF